MNKLQVLVSRMTAEQKLAYLLEGFDVSAIKANDQTEVYRFYEAKGDFFKFLARRFCRNTLKSNFSYFRDLMQEIYLHLPEYDYTSYKRLCKGIWRVMFVLCRPDILERRCVRLDAPIHSHSHKMDASFRTFGDIAILSDLHMVNPSDSGTLERLIDWLKINLPACDFLYVYLRYIEFATTDEILDALGCSKLCGESFLTRWDYRIMQVLREKYIDLCNYVGGIFHAFLQVLPQSIERRCEVMRKMFRFLIVPKSDMGSTPLTSC
jgi:hypothetical protein